MLWARPPYLNPEGKGICFVRRCLPSFQNNTWHVVGAQGVFTEYMHELKLGASQGCRGWLFSPLPRTLRPYLFLCSPNSSGSHSQPLSVAVREETSR